MRSDSRGGDLRRAAFLAPSLTIDRWSQPPRFWLGAEKRLPRSQRETADRHREQALDNHRRHDRDHVLVIDSYDADHGRKLFNVLPLFEAGHRRDPDLVLVRRWGPDHAGARPRTRS